MLAANLISIFHKRRTPWIYCFSLIQIKKQWWKNENVYIMYISMQYKPNSAITLLAEWIDTYISNVYVYICR